MINTTALPNGLVKIRRNGFIFTISATMEDDVFGLLDDYGKLSSIYEVGAIEHDPGNNRTLDWFIPANIPTVLELQEVQVLTDLEAAALIESYRQQNYARVASHGVTWDYYSLHCKVYLDDEVLGEIELASNLVDGIEDIYNQPEINNLIEDLIGDTLPVAFQTSARFAKVFSELTIHVNNNEKPIVKEMDEIDTIIDDLETYGATFIVSGLREYVSPEAIRQWVTDTKGIGEEEFAFPETPLDTVYDKAIQISQRLLATGEWK